MNISKHVSLVFNKVAASTVVLAMVVSMFPAGLGGFNFASALDTTFKSPTSNVSNNSGAGDDWSDPEKAYSNGSGAATEVNGERHRYYDFGFSIPSGSTINGIEVKADAWSTAASDSDSTSLDPISTGNYNLWTATAGTKVDAVDSDGGDSIDEITLGEAQTFGMENAGVPANSTITSVTLKVDAKRVGSGSDPKIKLRVENGTGVGQQSDGSEITLTGGDTVYSRTMTTNPLTGSAWTLAEVNAWTTKFGVIKTNATAGSRTARVDQIWVEVSYTTTSAGCQLGVDLSWNGGSTWTNEKTQNLTGTETTHTIGGAADLWVGHSWTPSDFSNSNFRLRVHDIDPGSTCFNDAEAHLDWIQAKVHYTEPLPATVVATKIVCDSEADLPNWGGAGNPITASTVSDFLATHSDNCHVQPGWQFQWAPEGTSNPGDNGTTPAGSPWTTFGPTNESGVATAQVTINSGTDEYFWVREVLQSGYLGFNSNGVSAEMYCSTDGLVYDNMDRVDGPVAGGTYYCVAFNAPAFGSLTAAIATAPDQSGETFGISSSALGLAYPMTDSAAGSDTQVFSSTLTPGTYDLHASPAPTGWIADGASCSDGSDPATVAVSAGENVTCTFTYKRLPNLNIVKYAAPTESTFDINVTGPSELDQTFTANVSGDGTDSSGDMFDSVQPGEYTLTETLPEGWDGVSSVSCYEGHDTVASGSISAGIELGYGDNVTCVFNNTPYSTIVGEKYEDLDGKGESTSGPGLENWTINLHKWTDAEDEEDSGYASYATATTDEGGFYSFGNILPGKYRVCESMQGGWYQSTPSAGTVCPGGYGYVIEIPEVPAIGAGQTYSGNSFGNYRLGSIAGLKWNDVDANGVLCTVDMAEAELCTEEQAPSSNWTINLSGADYSDSEVTSGGAFSFTDLEPGTYTLGEQMQDGWVQTYPGTVSGTHTVVVQSGNHKLRNFGNVQDSTISGDKWKDVDGDGVRDEGDSILNSPNFTFNLHKIVGETSTFVTSVTSSSGHYNFAGLLPGTYQVCEADMSGWLQTFPADAGCYDVIVGINQDSIGNDFGNAQVTTLSGMKFEDKDRDGHKDWHEHGLSGWTIVATPMVVEEQCVTVDESPVCHDVLVEDTSRTAKTTVTDSIGNYSFQFVGSETGKWRVSEVNQAGWTQTAPVSTYYDVDIVAGENQVCKDFGNWKWPVVQIYKWTDLNSDGVEDQGEGPVEGYPVAVGRTIETTTVDATTSQQVIDTEIVALQLTGSDGFASIALNPDWFGGFSGLDNAINSGKLSAFEGQKSNWTKTFPNFPHNDTINLTWHDGVTSEMLQTDSFFDIFTDGEGSTQSGTVITEGKQHDTISPIISLHFGNHFTAPVTVTPPPPPGGGGNGPIVGSMPTGQVLGASTGQVLGDSVCATPLLTQYMRRGKKNDPEQVKKLQQFLNEEMKLNLPLTGFFGSMTEDAVKAFQTKYADQVLTPWNLSAPTGLVYKTTMRQINLIYCASLNIPMPDLTPWTEGQ